MIKIRKYYKKIKESQWTEFVVEGFKCFCVGYVIGDIIITVMKAFTRRKS